MPRKKPKVSKAQSWKELPQTARNRSLSKELLLQRKRRRRRLATVFGIVLFAGGLVLTGHYYYQKNPDVFRFSTSSSSLENIHITTNGVLKEDWVKDYLDLSYGVDLMAIDIGELDQMLEFNGQIQHARVRRLFPHTLEIEIEEHTPIMRVRVSKKSGGAETMLISEEGYVYRSDHYPEGTVANLPYLAGVRLKKNSGEYLPLEGMQSVNEFLKTARTYYPRLYNRLRVVSLQNYSPGEDLPWSTIRAVTKDRGVWIFRPTDYESQLDRLHVILQKIAPRDLADLKRIDLSMEDRAAVRIAKNPDRPRRYR